MEKNKSITIWNLLLVAIGGMIGLAGGLAGTLVSHKLNVSEAYRQELLNAYVDWSAALLSHAHKSAMADWESDRLLQNGKSEEARMEMSDRHAVELTTLSLQIQAAQMRLLLLEADEDYVKEIYEIEKVRVRPDAVHEPLYKLFRKIMKEHPLLRRPSK